VLSKKGRAVCRHSLPFFLSLYLDVCKLACRLTPEHVETRRRALARAAAATAASAAERMRESVSFYY